MPGWLRRLADDSTKPDTCIDCGAGITISASSWEGMSRCNDCNLIAMNMTAPREKGRK